MKPRFKFRNPPFKVRVLVVASFFALPGTLAGMLASLWLGRFVLCAIVGLTVGMLTGAALEAGEDILRRND